MASEHQQSSCGIGLNLSQPDGDSLEGTRVENVRLATTDGFSRNAAWPRIYGEFLPVEARNVRIPTGNRKCGGLGKVHGRLKLVPLRLFVCELDCPLYVRVVRREFANNLSGCVEPEQPER